MPRKLIFFYNPISGTKSKTALLELLQSKTTAQGLDFELIETNAAGDYHFLNDKIKEGVTDIIVCGGDGTVNQVATALLNSEVNIGIIPMGSGNGLALAAGIPTNAGKALDIIFKGKASPIDGFYINQYFSCMLCGLGFDAQVAHDFAKQSKRGLSTYIKETFSNFFSAKAYPFILEIDNNRIKAEAFFISIANSNQFGNNVTIAPQASICDGLIDIVVVKKMSKARLIFSLFKQIKMGQITTAGKKYHKEDILYYQSKNISIQNPSEAPLHIDGDPAITAKHFDIKIMEKAFKLLQP
ncbi:MAG: YegS/Rv2252/BmrU family lipid kinase [Rhizobacter sp.]|nr:YegS/Rv2252/BmrU family lipid kinase [Ferruginibacter sp.]